jgi:hypothetical protein
MDTITVTFVDETTSKTIATVDLPVENLLDTFELENHLGLLVLGGRPSVLRHRGG